MSDEVSEVPVFACCSIGIGRWFWIAWESESDARALSAPLASGYEASAARAQQKAIERVGPGVKRIPSKWASGYKRDGGASRVPNKKGKATDGDATRPRVRQIGTFKRDGGATRLAFLYSATACELPDSLGHVAVARHRIVKQNARKIHVDCDPFDEDEWARRVEQGGESSGDAPKTRTLGVDRIMLRTEGRFRCRHARHDLIFYASEQDGIRDVEAALTAKYAWCATLGIEFPCSADSIKAAYRRLAMTSHPDAGGDPAEFRAIERAYREALAYFSQADVATSLSDPG
ncbi:MAG: DnaJ domain-containing protein [Isosphaeraceae bacterium]